MRFRLTQLTLKVLHTFPDRPLPYFSHFAPYYKSVTTLRNLYALILNLCYRYRSRAQASYACASAYALRIVYSLP